LAVSVFEIEG
jgi:hypothetical protein